MPTTARRSVLGATALAVFLAAGTGCSSGSGRAGSDSEVLEGLGVLAEDGSTKQVVYLDVAKAREVSKGYERGLGSVGLPGSVLSGHAPPPWGEALRMTQVDASIDTESAGRWSGTFDVEAITAELKANGYRQTGDDETWTSSDRNGLSLRVSKLEILYTVTSDASMAAVNPENGDSLGDKEEYQRITECLGDVYRADFSALTSAKPVHLSALGQRASTGTTGAKNTEILCLIAKDEATADRAAANLRSVVAEESPTFDGTKVTVEKGDQPLVRAVVPDTGAQRPGRLILSDIDLWMAIAPSEF
ncbi:hypothetical protein ACF05L_37905 [Streptomyces bobili]|uniref:hypothetical protein n=1 Tax=Streptomyces bobili TaxID=67280 RepID=UPI00370314D9